jgi:uncharacterized FAD-dependent dehydrogenase
MRNGGDRSRLWVWRRLLALVVTAAVVVTGSFAPPLQYYDRRRPLFSRPSTTRLSRPIVRTPQLLRADERVTSRILVLYASKKRQRRSQFSSSSSSSSSSNSTNKRREYGQGPSGGTEQQCWRIFGVEVHPDELVVVVPESSTTATLKDDNETFAETDMFHHQEALHPAVLSALYRRLGVFIPAEKDDSKSSLLSATSSSSSSSSSLIKVLKVVRQSVDARRGGRGVRRQDGGTGPRFVYVIDVEINNNNNSNNPFIGRLRHQPGKMELLAKNNPRGEADNDSSSSVKKKKNTVQQGETDSTTNKPSNHKYRRDVIIVGAGPAGLFCALQLLAQNDKKKKKTKHRDGSREEDATADFDFDFVRPIILERGQSVEKRGQSIGALIHRQALDAESNFCFGEGGAGTWSDGKLTTRIGRNSQNVRLVLETLVQYGAPRDILVQGAPHLGTDNLVRLLRNMRLDLEKRGGEIWFGTKMTEFIVQDGVVKGVKYEKTTPTSTDADKQDSGGGCGDGEDRGDDDNDNADVLYGDAVVLATGHSARDVYEQLHAAGVELQAKGFAVGFRVEHPQKYINKMQYGKEWGPSVNTGRKTTDAINQEYFSTLFTNGTGDDSNDNNSHHAHAGRLPVPSYRLATNEAFDGEHNRGVYSFCMCPGGQIVPTSTDPNEICVNGMSFSRRDSLWANSALVATVAPDDPILEPYRKEHGVMAGLAFQREMEQRAAIMGGGNLKVPVQRVTDFVAARPSISAPSSSYRLGVTPAACHEIYPPSLTTSIRNALVEYFDKQMPGFVCDEGLLHAVETRTSSPVRVSRDDLTMQAIGAARLFPAGEGAGFAGGIVSAAVDGLSVAEAVWGMLFGDEEQVVESTRTFDSKGVPSFY